MKKLNRGLMMKIFIISSTSFYDKISPIKEYLINKDNKNVFLVETYDEATRTTVTKEIEPNIYQSNENYYYVSPDDFQSTG